MKKLALLLSALLVVAGVASAATKSAKGQATTPAKSQSAAKTHVVEAEVVSADATAKTLTVKTDKGEATVKVDAAASSHLKTLKAGEKVKLTCRDNEKGEHEAITKIQVEKSSSMK